MPFAFYDTSQHLLNSAGCRGYTSLVVSYAIWISSRKFCLRWPQRLNPVYNNVPSRHHRTPETAAVYLQQVFDHLNVVQRLVFNDPYNATPQRPGIGAKDG
jgi:hypothetical protein